MGVDARPEGPLASLGHVTKGELCREQALVSWCSRPSDTRTGEKSPKRTPLEHAGGLLEHAGCQPPVDRRCALSRGAAVTAPPIAPVIPSSGRVAGALRAGPAAVRPLPMAGPAAALSVPAGVVYGTGRIDASR